ncbi:uncharacterized protein [Fopius arisanus]|uniref:RoseRS_3853_0 protein n=1 Tax=Fopius arisanus TaxID=64838 RepID=A0A0C9RKC0_9HYME|nr:PREDICTED: uncharacterized protein LOC105267791 isoform X1 [Fopius arisanus]
MDNYQKNSMNSDEKIPFTSNLDDFRDCIFSESCTVFDFDDEPHTPRMIDIIEIKDTGCDAQFPGEIPSLNVRHGRNSFGSPFEKSSHRSRIPRLVKSKINHSLFHYRDTRNERLTKGRKLPIPENDHSKELSSNPKIDEKCESPDTGGAPQMMAPAEISTLKSTLKSDDPEPSEKLKIHDAPISIRDSRSDFNNLRYERAQERGVKIGQQISGLLEHVRKHHRVQNPSNPQDNALSIVKRVLRRDLTRRVTPEIHKDTFPQFYIGSNASKFKLFRCGDEWTHL